MSQSKLPVSAPEIEVTVKDTPGLVADTLNTDAEAAPVLCKKIRDPDVTFGVDTVTVPAVSEAVPHKLPDNVKFPVTVRLFELSRLSTKTSQIQVP